MSDHKANTVVRLAVGRQALDCLRQLMDDAHFNAEKKSWTIGPLDDGPGSRLEYARQVLAKGRELGDLAP